MAAAELRIKFHVELFEKGGLLRLQSAHGGIRARQLASSACRSLILNNSSVEVIKRIRTVSLQIRVEIERRLGFSNGVSTQQVSNSARILVIKSVLKEFV